MLNREGFEVSDTSVCAYFRVCAFVCVCVCVCVCVFEKESFTQMLESAEAEVEQAHATICALEEVSLSSPLQPPHFSASIFPLCMQPRSSEFLGCVCPCVSVCLCESVIKQKRKFGSCRPEEMRRSRNSQSLAHAAHVQPW